MRYMVILGFAFLYSTKGIFVSGNFDASKQSLCVIGRDRLTKAYPYIKCKTDPDSQTCLGLSIFPNLWGETSRSDCVKLIDYKQFQEDLRNHNKSTKICSDKHCLILMASDQAKQEWPGLLELTDSNQIFVFAIVRIIHGFLFTDELCSINEGYISEIQSSAAKFAQAAFEFPGFKEAFIEYCDQNPIPTNYLEMLKIQCFKQERNEYYWRYRFAFLEEIMSFLSEVVSITDPEPGFIICDSEQGCMLNEPKLDIAGICETAIGYGNQILERSSKEIPALVRRSVKAIPALKRRARAAVDVGKYFCRKSAALANDIMLG